MLRSGLAIVLALGLVGTVVAQSDPIATRRNIMKGVGGATRTATLMAKGEQPFDLAKAQEVFKVYAAAAENSPKNYPDGSMTGGDTTASPKIWENRAEFEARFAAWGKEIKAAEADTKDLDTFKASFATVSKSCGTCHQAFRVTKS